VSLQAGYGANSETQHQLQQLATEGAEAMRSIRELAAFLDHHPGSLVWGR
jgi:hypothetical protein